MATVQELVNDVLVDINVLAPGETPTSSESDAAFRALNRILSKLNAEGSYIPSVTRTAVTLTGASSYTLEARPLKIKAASVEATVTESLPVELVDAAGWAQAADKGTTSPHARVAFYEDGYPTGTLHLAPMPTTGGTLEMISAKSMRSGVAEIQETLSLTGAASYTVGVGGTFATERPVEIKGLAVSASALVSRAAELVDEAKWAAYEAKGETSNFAEVLYYDAAVSSPKVYVAPKPAAGSLILYELRALTAFGSLGATITLPEGYEECLRKLLALDQCVSYGRADLVQVLGPLANEAKIAIGSLNEAVLGAPGAPPLNASDLAAPAPPPAQREQ